MKKLFISISVILCLLCMNIAYANVLEEDFSSSKGWHYTAKIYNTLNYNTLYNSGKHTSMSFADGTLSITNGYAQKTFDELTTGIVEVDFEAKRNGGISTVALVSSGGSMVSGIYQNGGTVYLNHEYGLSNYGGKPVSKLARRENKNFHKYVMKVNLDTGDVIVSVDGNEVSGLHVRNLTDVTRIAISYAEIKNLKIKHYYELDINDEQGIIHNIYDSGEITLTSESTLPDNTFLAAAVYRSGELIGVKTGEGTVTLTADDGDTIKGFLWQDGTMKPLTNGVVKASRVETTANALLREFENPESKYDFSEIKNKSFLEQENIVLYEREAPDDTRTLQQENAKANINREASWYSGEEDKPEQMLDLTHELADRTFSNGYTINITSNPLYYLLTGNIKKAEELIASKTSGYAFTDMSQYYMYFKYADMLSDEALANLKTTIYNECFNQTTGFSWNKGSSETALGAHHNQTYDGLVRGIFYGIAFDDAEVLSEAEDILDKIIASTAASGYAIGDYNSPCYGAMIWADLITLSDLLPEGDIKNKVDLLLNRVEAEIAVLYHSQTSNTVGPYARSGFGLAAGLNIRQNFPLMLYMLSDRGGFYKNNESSTYSFFYPLVAAYTHRLPEYIESIAYDKEYPYNVKIAKFRNATDGEYLIDPGLQVGHNDTVYQVEETTGYMTESYSLGSAPDTVWYMSGYRGQDNAFLARWKRSDTIKSLHDTPTLFSYYRYNSGMDGGESIFQPSEQGLSASAQYKNKAIVYSYPGKAEDEKLTDYQDNIYNMGTTIYITHPEDTKIYYEDELVAGEEVIAENNGKEARAKLNKLPYTAQSTNGTLYLEDKSIYAAVIPLNAAAVEIRDVTADCAPNGTIVPAYSINLLNVKSDEPKWFTQNERSAMRNGYIFEIAQKSEYSSLAAFKEHIRSGSFAVMEENGIWSTVYISGNDTLSLSFDTDNLYVTDITVNGEKQKNVFFNRVQDDICLYPKKAEDGYYNWNTSQTYKANPTVFYSDNLIQSQDSEIKIGDCTLENPDEAMVYIIYDKKTKAYTVGDLTAGENSFMLKTPYGNVSISNLNLGYAEFNGNTKELSLNKLVSDSTAQAVLVE